MLLSIRLISRKGCGGCRDTCTGASLPPRRGVLTDYHNHTPLCHHAEGNPIEYARHAESIGLAEIGLSDHNPMREHLDEWRMSIEQLPRYFDLVEEARQGVGIPVRLALECDYLEGREAWTDETAKLGNWDYLIGSVHYIQEDLAVDDPKYMNHFKTPAEIEQMWKLYWRLYEKMIRTKQYDFHAHPDLAKRFGALPAGDLRPYYEPVIQALVDTKGILEVSTASLRKGLSECYPARAMLEMAFSAKVPIVINSDAHKPTDVGADFAHALEFVRSVGYRETIRFNQRQRTVVPLPETWPL
ncbi:histidinol-phosphatase (PHP family) [Prosthecobacter fusiformis]|uniref:Histidinol-phosphatase n=1 Tax=Prosthecobacter fusiformis TaxID=48464 RepID=A0A4R7SSH5_9BACT|nr:histidinol-phosphatase (PHP family) [Prosthecobacter fusiformis]